MYTDYLLHFCGKGKARDEAEQVLSKILSSRHLKATRWKTFPSTDANATGDPPDPELAERHRARLEIAGITTPEDVKAFEERTKIAFDTWLQSLRFPFVSFTDLWHPEDARHRHVFGKFGVALKKDSRPGRSCHPVQYVKIDSPSFALAGITRRILNVFSLCRAELEKSEAVGLRVVLPQLLDILEVLELDRCAYFEDIKHLEQHEWRFVTPDNERKLQFIPGDLAFVVVDTAGCADEWNQRFRSDPALAEYHEAGVKAISVDSGSVD